METDRRKGMAMIGAAIGAATIGALGANGAVGSDSQAVAKSRKAVFWAACTTPCDKNLKVDLGAMRDQVQWFKQNGADGVTILGSTGEFASFTVAERKAVMEVVAKNKGAMSVLCTSGTCNVPDTIELSKHAADHGAEGVIVLPPFYYKKPTTEGLVRYYTMVMDALPASVSLYLYHVPHWSAVPISNDLVHGLKHYANLAGIKDSEDSATEYAGFAKDHPKMNIITGSLNNLEYALNHGMGGILQEAAPFCREIAAIYAAARTGKDIHPLFENVQSLMDRNFGNYDNNEQYGLMQFAMTAKMGHPQSYQRPPFVDLSDARKAQILREFKRA